MYTGGITFAAISSQGVTPSNERPQGDHSEDETKPPRDQDISLPGIMIAEPCSPKSVYCQANKVRLGFPVGTVVTNGSFFLGWVDRTLRHCIQGSSVQTRRE